VLPSSALILAAGLGTRLRPLTRERAKPALPVAGATLIERTVMWLAASGIRHQLVNLHHRADTITAVLGDGRRFGVRVRYSWEVPILGSGGGPRRAFALVPDERLWLINGDMLTDPDLASLVEAHDRSGALVTMAVVANPEPEHYGGALVAADDAITGFSRRGNATPSWLFVGVQLVEREAFAGLPDGEAAESVAGLYPRLIETRPGSVRAFRCTASFRDIGTPTDYLETCLALADEPATLVGAGCRVDPAARVTETVLWNRVTVGRDAVLDRCIVTDEVRIPDAFEARSCVIMKDGPWPLAADEVRRQGLRLTSLAGLSS
jgi:NDP-sugar pyrophosphorylase family protein